MAIRITSTYAFPVLIGFLVLAQQAAARVPNQSDHPICSTTYAGAADLEDQIEQAARDIRNCSKAGAIAPDVARKTLSSVENLRDMADYDRRRARGALSAGRQRRFEARLRYIMLSASGR